MSNTFRQSAIGRDPPLKGSFPLDHDGASKDYFKCRMENNLMPVEDMGKLGFREKSKGQLNEKSS